LDRRKIQHFDGDDPAEEAAALIRLLENGQCDADEIRELIAISESERQCLQFLADQGMLASVNVEATVKFRDRVLEKFNNLVDAEMAVLNEKIGGSDESSFERAEVGQRFFNSLRNE